MAGTQLGFTVYDDSERGPVLSTRLDLSVLESHLWEAANILRGIEQANPRTVYGIFADVPGFAHVATLDEIYARGDNLSIPLYVRSVEGPTAGGGSALTAAIAAWEESSQTLRSSMAELLTALAEIAPQGGADG